MLSANAKSVAVAAVVVVALLGLMVVLLARDSGPAARVGSGAAPPAAGAPAPTQALFPAEPRRSPEARSVDPVTRRQVFARRLRQLWVRKGKRIDAAATGPEATSLHMTWPAATPDRVHIDQLKQAAPFHRELRALGYRSLVLKVGDRVDWSLEL